MTSLRRPATVTLSQPPVKVSRLRSPAATTGTPAQATLLSIRDCV